MLLSGAGALYCAHVTNNWSMTFIIIAALFIISTMFLFSIKENIRESKHDDPAFSINLKALIINPFKDFFIRENSMLILTTIIFFKLGDAMLGIVSVPFYLDIGFTKEQIAIVVKSYGLIATLCGTYAGGFAIYKYGIFRGLIITGIIQTLTHIAFIWLNNQGPDVTSLLVAISIENFAGGAGTSALVAYLSFLCNKQYSATQYAMLSSAASFFNNSVTIYGGTLVALLGYHYFFIFTIIIAFPGILLLIYLNRKITRQGLVENT
jgi:PAT family beta-lactamase induction signal transducer AmpG